MEVGRTRALPAGRTKASVPTLALGFAFAGRPKGPLLAEYSLRNGRLQYLLQRDQREVKIPTLSQNARQGWGTLWTVVGSSLVLG
jgi:hypothetical protein